VNKLSLGLIIVLVILILAAAVLMGVDIGGVYIPFCYPCSHMGTDENEIECETNEKSYLLEDSDANRESTSSHQSSMSYGTDSTSTEGKTSDIKSSYSAA